MDVMTDTGSMPHSSWAEVYDLAYQRSFGALYSQLTARTLEVVADIVSPPAPIVDFGAGTGRLSVPLSQAGYRVTAVDCCPEMLDQLERKAPEVRCEACSMADFDGRGGFDLALCTFTVLPYLLDAESLDASLAAARRALAPGGALLIDVPSREVFASYTHCDEQIRRSVTVVAESNPFYRYSERISIFEGQDNWKEYSDSFLIRWWSPEVVLDALDSAGFSCESELSMSFAGSGSRYFLMRVDAAL